MSELRFENLSVHFGPRNSGLTAVNQVNLTVPERAVVGLVGESGSGKSTLARAAVGLSPVSSGRVLLNGNDIDEMPRRRRPIQMVFQDPYSSLNPRMTIGDSISEAIPRGAIRTKAARASEVAKLLEMVNLDPSRASALPRDLSGGQRQRVALARALAGRPDVLVADEITSALDVSVQGAVLNLVRDLQRELNLSMLFISHNLAVVRYLADVIAVMYLGRIVEVGPAEQVLAEPQHPYTRELLGALPSGTNAFLTDVAGSAEVADPPDPHNPPSGCHYHPRCPIGPMVRAGRELCVTTDPAKTVATRRHHTACHFAAELSVQEIEQGVHLQ